MTEEQLKQARLKAQQDKERDDMIDDRIAAIAMSGKPVTKITVGAALPDVPINVVLEAIHRNGYY